jgi:Ca2+-transporting ATPase
MTINVAACLVVMLGALLGTDAVLTVTQMLWVNLIMDTFAALALASLPPSESVMNEKPRSQDAHILTKPMVKSILTIGLLFLVIMLGLVQYFKHVEAGSMLDFSIMDYLCNYFNLNIADASSYTPYEHSLTFTIFVFLQFWNLFNAKAYHTGQSAFHNATKTFGGFELTLAIILVGQFLIVTFGGEMFNVEPLRWHDWLICFIGTSPVVLIGELLRLIKREKI